MAKQKRLSWEDAAILFDCLSENIFWDEDPDFSDTDETDRFHRLYDDGLLQALQHPNEEENWIYTTSPKGREALLRFIEGRA